MPNFVKQNILINAKPIKKESSKISNVKNMYCDQYGNAVNTGNVQGLGANQIAALSTDGVLFPKSIRNMSEISEVSEVSELCPKFEHCFYRNIANF